MFNAESFNGNKKKKRFYVAFHLKYKNHMQTKTNHFTGSYVKMVTGGKLISIYHGRSHDACFSAVYFYFCLLSGSKSRERDEHVYSTTIVMLRLAFRL